MPQEKSLFDADDLICHKCLADDALRDIVRSHGYKERCAPCGKRNVGVTISELAEIIDPVIRRHFTQGHFERRYGPGDDDRYWEEQQGDDLSSVLQHLLGQYLDCEEALIDALEDSNPHDPRSGEEPFYDRTTSYEEAPVHLGKLYEAWNAIGNELKTRRRFFSDQANRVL